MLEIPGGDRIFHRTLKKEWQYITHGDGIYLFDTEGKRYLDAAAGVHVVSIGHGVKEVVDAMEEQASKVCFTYGRFLTRAQVDLAEKSPNSRQRDYQEYFMFQVDRKPRKPR